jgi:hypothetical protein
VELFEALAAKAGNVRLGLGVGQNRFTLLLGGELAGLHPENVLADDTGAGFITHAASLAPLSARLATWPRGP